MKTTILLLAAILFSVTLPAQVNPGQIDDFENGTTENWTDGGSSVPPVNVASGGPAGAGDNYLSDPSLGGGGPGSRMVMFNDQQWTGNYTSNGIIAIRFHARALTNDLDLRVAFDGDGGRICTINAVTIPANGPWTMVEIPISVSDMTTVAGGSSVTQTLSAVSDMRILSNPNPSWQGESIVATLEIDNIEAATTLSVDSFSQVDTFKIYPNPGYEQLNIELTNLNPSDVSLEVFDIFGKRVLSRPNSTNLNTIPISEWAAGVYFIKLSNEGVSQVKKFIKI